MPLRAIKPDGTSILATDTTPEVWSALKKALRLDRSGWRLPCCDSPVAAKSSKLGTPFFSHVARSDCAYAAETHHHRALKVLAMDAARAHGWKVEAEVRGGTDGEPWIADVLAERGKHRVAVEIQWSAITNEDLMRRQKRYQSAGVRALWLIRRSHFPLTNVLPAACVRESEDGYMALLPAEDGPRRVSDSYAWAQQLAARDLLEAAFGNRFQWGFREGNQLTYRIMAAPAPCWICKATTNLVLRVELDFDGTEMYLNLWDFDLAPSLFEELLPDHVRIAQGIGAILVRYSRTAGERKLSNGCIKCDRLQGSFFDHRVLNDMEPVHHGTGVVDKRWLKVLSEGQPWHWRVLSPPASPT